MNWKTEWKKLLLIVVVFAVCFYLPVGKVRFDSAVTESLVLVKEYARQHVCFALYQRFSSPARLLFSSAKPR